MRTPQQIRRNFYWVILLLLSFIVVTCVSSNEQAKIDVLEKIKKPLPFEVDALTIIHFNSCASCLSKIVKRINNSTSKEFFIIQTNKPKNFKIHFNNQLPENVWLYTKNFSPLISPEHDFCNYIRKNNYWININCSTFQEGF